MKKVYSKELGVYVSVDPVTRMQQGEGLFDSIFSAAAKQTAKQLAKETIQKSASAALDTGSKKLGEKVGQYVAEKITPTKTSVTPVTPVTPVTQAAKPGALIKEIKKYAAQNVTQHDAPRDIASEIGKILGKGKKNALSRAATPEMRNIRRRINRLL